ncbi:MFS transporter [Pseudoxanthobacter sp.]|uniref:MFS transporter n=1 Tax=Pseudoxanthobacter sp. TaxID=1925742 RepID=UPI002FE0F75B
MAAPSCPPGRKAIVSWVLFDCATQPFYSLVMTFVIPAYFANVLVGDGVRGQALWGYATSLAGILLAIGAPVLGALADAGGRLKTWLALSSIPLVAGSALLWFAMPGTPDAVFIALAAYVLGTLGAEFATVFNNAMLPALAPPERIGRLSGFGWAAGYVAGIFVVLTSFAFIIGSPKSGLTMIGIPPLFGLDTHSYEGERLIGPLSALWYVVVVTPLFLFVPERRSLPGRTRAADRVRTGLGRLRATIAQLPRQPMTARFLLAQMLYSDGLVALFALGTLLGASQFGWRDAELGIFGLLLSFCGAIGAIAGGWLDDRLGPKPVITGSLVMVTLTTFAFVSIGRDHVLFVVATAPAPPGSGGLFASASEQIFMAVSIVLGLALGPLQSASRTLLAALAPAEDMAAFFGLYALTGKLTSFAAPLTVAVVTSLTQSQQAGFAAIPAFFMAGLWLLAGVRVAPRAGGKA